MEEQIFPATTFLQSRDTLNRLVLLSSSVGTIGVGRRIVVGLLASVASPYLLCDGNSRCFTSRLRLDAAGFFSNHNLKDPKQLGGSEHSVMAFWTLLFTLCLASCKSTVPSAVSASSAWKFQILWSVCVEMDVRRETLLAALPDFGYNGCPSARICLMWSSASPRKLSSAILAGTFALQDLQFNPNSSVGHYNC